VPSLFATRNALAFEPRPKKIDVEVVDPVAVHVHDLPVSSSDTVEEPTSVRASVAGAHGSVPRSPVRVIDAPVVVTADVNVPVPSFLLAIEPCALPSVPVPESRAYRAMGFAFPLICLWMRKSSVKRMREREANVGLDPEDEAARWLAEHAPKPPADEPKAARKSKLLHQFRNREVVRWKGRSN
jgi:hypothetical protein